MFTTKTRGFCRRTKNKGTKKKILLKSKIIEKRSGKGFKPNELIKKATNNLNKTRSAQQKTASVPIK